MKKIYLVCSVVLAFYSCSFAQSNVGIGTNDPKSKLDIKGGVTIGNSYSGVNSAPANGAIIEGPVGIGTSNPDTKAALDVTSTNKGMYIPRLNNTQAAALGATLNATNRGLLIFNTDNNQTEFWDGTQWKAIGSGVGGPPTGSAGGGLTGTYPNPLIANNAVGSSQVTDGSLTGTDISDGSITGTDIANGSVPLSGANSKVNGVLPVDNGGTGVNTITGIIQGNGSSPMSGVSATGGSQYLRRNAGNTAYEFGQINYGEIAGVPSSLPPNGTANGDLSGTYPNPSVDGLQGRPVLSTAPASGEVLKWNGSAWAPAADNNSGTVTGSGTVNYMPKWTSATGLSSTSLIYDNGTNVGIGSSFTSPQHPLSVGAATSDAQLVAIRGYSNAPGSWKGGGAFGYTSASVIMGELSGMAQIGGHSATLNAWANLAINSGGGNVGVRTSSPLAKLSVGDGSLADNNLPVQISTGAAGTESYYGVNKNGAYGLLLGYTNGAGLGTKALVRNITADPLSFYVNNTTEAMTILSNGNVGVGVSPGVKLDVAGTGAVDYLRVDPQDATNEGGEVQLVGAGTNGTVQIDNYVGNVRIHTLASGKVFDVIGGNGVKATGAQFTNLAGSGTRMVTADAAGNLGTQTLPGGVLPSGTTGQTLYNNAGTWTATSNLFNDGSTINLGSFTTPDIDEWPKVTWLRDAGNNWDEGLIKGNSAKGMWGRTGFGIHMHSSRHFGFYSSGWDALLDIEGGSGRTYIKGNVGLGTNNPSGKLHAAGTHINGIFQDGSDRPSLGATGVYPQMVMMAGGSGNASHGATLAIGSYDAGTSGNHKHWSIGSSGQNSTFLDIGYHGGTDLNPHAGIRNYNGSTFMTLLNNGNIGMGILDPQSKLHVMGKINLHQSGAGGGQNRFEGLQAPTDANGRAQFVMSSAYSDLVVASSQANDNHGSTLTFATYNPSNAADYRKWVLNQGNWGARSQFLDFGYATGIPNPHSAINSGNTTMSLDGVNKYVGIGSINPIKKLQVQSDHYKTQLMLFSDNNGQGYQGANTAILNLWASEPCVSWTGVGIGNNWQNSDGTSCGPSRINTTRGASFITLQDNQIQMSTVNSSGTVKTGMTVQGSGVINVPNLSGTGNRMVMADASGNLVTNSNVAKTDVLYIRGTGLNNNANRIVRIGNTEVVNGNVRGLNLTIVSKATHAVVSTTNYDTYGDPAASNNLASAINGMNNGQIGILTSYDAWEGQITPSLQQAFARVGLYKAASTTVGGSRRSYAAIFEPSSSSTVNSASASEVEHSDEAQQPYAEMRGWLIEGGYVATTQQPSGLSSPTGKLSTVMKENGDFGILGLSGSGDRPVYVDASGFLRAGSSLEVATVGDSRVTFAGTWNYGSGAWGGNRLSNSYAYNTCSGSTTSCLLDYIVLSLNNNQYKSVYVSDLDWNNCGAAAVYLSFDGGATYNFNSRFSTFRNIETTGAPYTSTIRCIADNLPTGNNVRVKLVAERGRFHFEGFGLSKQVNGQEGLSTIFPHAKNLLNDVGGFPGGAYYFDTHGGSVMLNVSGSGYGTSAKLIGMEIYVDGVWYGRCRTYTNEASSHKTFSTNFMVINGLSAGTHNITFGNYNSTNYDANDIFNASIIELPPY